MQCLFLHYLQLLLVREEFGCYMSCHDILRSCQSIATATDKSFIVDSQINLSVE